MILKPVNVVELLLGKPTFFLELGMDVSGWGPLHGKSGYPIVDRVGLETWWIFLVGLSRVSPLERVDISISEFFQL